TPACRATRPAPPSPYGQGERRALAHRERGSRAESAAESPRRSRELSAHLLEQELRVPAHGFTRSGVGQPGCRRSCLIAKHAQPELEPAPALSVLRQGHRPKVAERVICSGARPPGRSCTGASASPPR